MEKRQTLTLILLVLKCHSIEAERLNELFFIQYSKKCVCACVEFFGTLVVFVESSSETTMREKASSVVLHCFAILATSKKLISTLLPTSLIIVLKKARTAKDRLCEVA